MSKFLKRASAIASLLVVTIAPSVSSAVGGLGGPVFGVSTAPNGNLLVADAGAGITVVRNDVVTSTIALPGVAAVAPIGSSSMWAVTGGVDPGADSGQGLHRVSNGRTRLIANLFAFEQSVNPDGISPPDSNPYDVVSLGGNAALVVDAGGNDLLRVDNRGRIAVVATFPVETVSTANFNALAGCPPVFPLCALPFPTFDAEPVPTSVAVGPDGAMYVGELKGFPAPVDESNIWRIEPGATGATCGVSASCTKVFDGGFTSIVDMEFGPDGRLYISELDEASWASVEIFGTVTGGTVNACDLTTLTCAEVATGIPVHTAITFDKNGALWGSRNALTPGGAEVVAL